MAGYSHAGNLGHFELERLTDWFLYHMPMEQRRQLMAEMPVLYAKLYPEVPVATLTGVLATALHDMGREGDQP